MEYDYYELEPGESQYDGLDLSKPVEARYVKADSEKERGNPLIEALPPGYEGEDTARAYSMGIPGYHYSDVASMTRAEKHALIRQYRDIRLPLFYQQSIEDGFRNALCSSYGMRTLVPVNDAVTKIKMNNKEEVPEYVTWSEADMPMFGFISLTGTSGVGKTSTFNTLFTHYPQVLLHNLFGGRLTQVVYLFVVCPANSNLNILYEAIGRAIDHAIGNTAHDYQRYIAKGGGGLSGKAQRVVELIELFSVGVIVFDEIQNLDFTHNGDHGFSTLLYILNTTHVGFICVGLPEASEKIGAELQIRRRVGDEIDGGDYCEDRKCFEIMVNALFHYQIFVPPVEVTPEILDSLYQHTLGVVDFLVTIYSCMSLDYIDCEETPTVDADFIAEVVQRHYPRLEKLLKEQRYDDIYILNENVKSGINAIFANDEVEQRELIVSNAKGFAEEAIIRDEVIAFISASLNYEPSTINAAFNKVIKHAKNKTQKEINEMVIDELKNTKKRTAKKPKVKHVDTTEIQNMSKKDAPQGSGTAKKESDAV